MVRRERRDGKGEKVEEVYMFIGLVVGETKQPNSSSVSVVFVLERREGHTAGEERGLSSSFFPISSSLSFLFLSLQAPALSTSLPLPLQII